MSKEDSLAHAVREKTNSATAAENFAIVKEAMTTSAEQAYYNLHYMHTYCYSVRCFHLCMHVCMYVCCVGEAGIHASDEDHARAVRAVSAPTISRKEDTRGHSNLQDIQRSRLMVFPPSHYMHTYIHSFIYTYIHTLTCFT
jgi:hypothetical protein